MGGLIGKLDRYRQSGYLANKVEIAGHIAEELAVPIWNYLAVRVPLSDVDDLRQEVLLAVVLKLDQCKADNEGSAWSWVYTIARGKIANRFEKDVQWQLIEREEVFRLIEASTEVEGMTRHERVSTEDLLAALDKLDKETRFCIWLCFVEQLSFVQVATLVGKSDSGVRMACKRGLVKLQKLLERNS